MKTKSIAAILALAALSSFANPAQNQVAPQAVPQATQPYAVPQPYAPPANYQQPQYHGLPQKITTTIQQMYPGVFITDVDWEPYGYEIELSNRMEMHFDTNGNLLGQKWDD